MNINEILTRIFDEKGVYLSENDFTEELVMDSITFISIVVAIEESFNIMIPDEYLLIDRMNSFEKVLAVVNSLL